MSNRRLLLSFAHPDDESFGTGALIAKYVAEGADVYYICATDGDVGTIPDDMKGLYPTVRELRLAELDAASAILGFKHVFKFGYKDSGMMGAESTHDPACLWDNWNHHPEAVTRRVVEVIRDIRPQVIVTFNRYGGYGHPDHIAIQRATTEAFTLAADPHYLTDGQQPYVPQRLYYTAIPGLFLRIVLFWMRLRGHDVRRMGLNKDIDFQAVVDHIEPTHVRVNIAPYTAIGDAASACHKSQGGGSTRGVWGGLPKWLRRRIFGKQRLTRVHPAPTHNRVDEDDLFADVRLDEPVAERV